MISAAAVEITSPFAMVPRSVCDELTHAILGRGAAARSV
jgi:hypothetical protein